MADLPVSPIRLLASLRQLSKQFLVAEEELRIARDAWDDANLSQLEAESSEPMDQQVVDQFTADEDRLEAAMMQLSYQFFEIEDTIDSVSHDLAFVIPWPSETISEAIRRLETKIGLKPHNFVDGRTLQDLQEFPGLVLAIDERDWAALPQLPVWAMQDTVEVSKVVAERVTSQPLANENAGGAKRGKQKRGPSQKVVNAEMARLAKQLNRLKVAAMTADQWQVELEKVGICTSTRTIDRTDVYRQAKEKSYRCRDRSSVKAERAGDLVHQLADEEVQTTNRRSPKSSRHLA